MVLSKACEYGLRAVLYIVSIEPEGYTPIREIAKALDISAPFITKIFQQLTAAGYLESMKGPNGGVRLAVPASDIAVADLVKAIDGEGLFQSCFLGLPNCNDAAPCPMHDKWKTHRTAMSSMMRSTSVADLGSYAQQDRVRLRAE